MRRLFWVALGATAGVLIARRITRAAEALTPQSLAHSLATAITELGEAIGDFVAEVRAGMAEREEALNEALGITSGGTAGSIGDGAAGTTDRTAGTADARGGR